VGKIYVTSDIHGCYDKYIELLKLINFNDEDTLYIIGDIIDRGTQNVAMLKDVMSRKNVVMILGNHEDMMVESKKPFGYIDKRTWYFNGGDVTDAEFNMLSKGEQIDILNFLSDLPFKLEIEVEGKKYLLVHGSYRSMHLNMFNDDTSRQYKEDIIWNRIKGYEEGLKDKTVIFGHSITKHYQNCKPYKIWKNKKVNIIGIDCGMAAYAYGEENGRLACLRLNDMKEFYV